jgi:trimethylamine---corrinoid protein Co-methyltransferase
LLKGAVTARERANTVWKTLREGYAQPPLDAGIDDAITDYVARRKAAGGAPMN